MGTAGLAGQPLIKNQKGAHATTGVRHPAREATSANKKRSMIRRGYAPSYGAMRGCIREPQGSILALCSALGVGSLPACKGLLRRFLRFYPFRDRGKCQVLRRFRINLLNKRIPDSEASQDLASTREER